MLGADSTPSAVMGELAGTLPSTGSQTQPGGRVSCEESVPDAVRTAQTQGSVVGPASPTAHTGLAVGEPHTLGSPEPPGSSAGFYTSPHSSPGPAA